MSSTQEPTTSESSLPSQFGGRANNNTRRRQKPNTVPELGVGDVLGAGDSYLVADLLPNELAEDAFNKLRAEVQWQTMYHRGKLLHI